jgi:peptide/nickel transport system substrate-binding protein
MKLISSVCLVIVLLLSTVLSCAPQPTPAPAVPPQPTAEALPTAETLPTATAEPVAAPPAKAKILVIALGHEIDSLDPAHAMTPTPHMVHLAVYDTLIALAPDDIGALQPSLAEDWDVSPDGLVITFYLRDGVSFHTGRAVTSQDVKWSWERVKGAKGNPSYHFDGILSIETPDDNTLVVTLAEPDPGFLFKSTYPAFSVLDSETVAAHGGVSGPDAETQDTAETWLNQNSAGTGPYVLRNWTIDSEIVIDKIVSSWRGIPDADQVIYKHIPQTAARKIALEAGDVDIALNLTREEAQALQGNPNVTVVSGPGLETFFLLANRNPEVGGILSDPTVVLAMRYAIDYEGIKSLAGFAASHPPTVIAIGLFGAWDEDKAIKRDLDKARELLAEAGYPDGFTVDLPYPTDFTTSGVDVDLVAQKVQADLAEVGIEVKLQPTELMANLADYRAGKLGFTLWPWLPSVPDINGYLQLLPGGVLGNRSQWTEERADPEILALRDQARVEADPQKRIELWNQIQEYLVQEGPYIGLVQAGLQMGLRNNIKGFIYNPIYGVEPSLITKE